ncbi:hypothetical protein BSNK01_14120 [Bacillaceae bacterium]
MGRNGIAALQEKKKGRLWIVRDAQKRKYVLKRIPAQKTPFSILLQERLYELWRDKCLTVPKIYAAETGSSYVQHDDGYYFLSAFVDDLAPLSKNQRIKSLAKFHASAQFPELAKFREKQRFPDKRSFLKSYQKKIADLKKWRSRATSPTLKRAISEMVKLGKESCARIASCRPEAYLRDVAARHSICHGDFHSRNVFLTRDRKLLLLDFDKAHYGLPLTDFRFMMMSLTKSPYPENKLKKLFRGYFKHFPQERKHRAVYVADAMFPHEFHKQVKKLLHKGKVKKLDAHGEKLVETAKRERQKYAALQREWEKA